MAPAYMAVSAVVPSLLLMWYFHRRDVFREPARDLWMVFGGGVLIVAPVLAVARPIDPWIDAISEPLVHGLVSAFAQAAIPEEFFKFIVLWFAASRAAFDEPMDGIVYGVAASLGFATFENVVYVANGGFAVALTRALTAVPSHAFLGVIMGYCVGRAKFEPEARVRLLATGLLLPTFLHGLYDWPLLAAAKLGSADPSSEPLALALLSLAPILVVSEWIAAIRLTRRQRRQQLQQLDGESYQHRLSAGEKWSSIALTLTGIGVATLGGLFLLGTVWLAIAGQGEARSAAQALATVALMGVTPTLIGVALFLWGVRRLNEG